LAEIVQSEVTIDYDNKRLFWNNTDLPGFPSSKISEYEAELANWVTEFGVPIDSEAMGKLVRKDASGGFSGSLYTGNDELLYDVHQPLWHVMRDILFLETMQHSIGLWHDKYVASIDNNDIEFVDAYKDAKKLTEYFFDYQENKRSGTNPLVNAIFGTGKHSWGNIFEADGSFEGLVESQVSSYI